MRLSSRVFRKVGEYAIAVAQLPHVDPASDIRAFSGAIERTVSPLVSRLGSTRLEVVVRERHGRLQRLVSEVVRIDRRYPSLTNIPEHGQDGIRRWYFCWRGISEERGLARRAYLESQTPHGRGRNRHRRRLQMAGESYWAGLTAILDKKRCLPPPDQVLQIALSTFVGGSFFGALTEPS